MTFQYSLTAEDFLAYQLFTASKSERIRRKRRRNWMYLTIAWILLAFVFYFSHKMALGVYFGVLAVITLAFYPLYSRWRYRRHYSTHIKEHYQGRIGKEATLVLGEEHIHTSDPGAEGKIRLTELKEIWETGQHFFLRLNTDMSFILPKTAVENLEAFRAHFAALDVPIRQELDWKWK